MSNVIRLFEPVSPPGEQMHNALFSKYNKDSPIMFPVTERPCMYYSTTRERHYEVPDYKVLVNSRNGLALSVVGSGYQVVQNAALVTGIEREMLNVFDKSMFDYMTVQDRQSYNGRVTMRVYTFPSISLEHLCAKLNYRVIIYNAYGGVSFRVITGFIDLICTNGLMVGDYSSFYHRHTKGLQLDKVIAFIKEQTEAAPKMLSRVKDWIKYPLDSVVLHDIFMHLEESEMLSARQLKAIRMRYDMHEASNRGRTLWSLISAFTWWATCSPFRKTKHEHVHDTRLQREMKIGQMVDVIVAFIDRTL